MFNHFSCAVINPIAFLSMKNLYFIKQGSSLVPANDECQERMKRVKQGAMVLCEVVQPRNIAFHKKFFALLNFAFEYFEPQGEEYKGQAPEKNFDRFRKDVLILAGYYTVVSNIKNETRVEAKSISFGSMDEQEFQELYQACFRVLWSKVLSSVANMTEQEVEHIVDRLGDFA